MKHGVARSEVRRACEVSIALDCKSTPIASARSVPSGDLAPKPASRHTMSMWLAVQSRVQLYLQVLLFDRPFFASDEPLPMQYNSPNWV